MSVHKSVAYAIGFLLFGGGHVIEFRCSNVKCSRPADFKEYVGRTPGGHEIVKKVPVLKCPVCNSDIRPLPE